MATTRLIPSAYWRGAARFSTAMEDIIDYVENPEKLILGRLIYGYECDTRTADAKFTLAKRPYQSYWKFETRCRRYNCLSFSTGI